MSGLTLQHKPSLSHSPVSQPWHSAFKRVTPTGAGGLESCALAQGLFASDMRNGLFHADSALPAPWPQIHRQIAAALLRLRVLWLGAYQGGAGTQDLAFKLSSTQLIQILNLASDCLPFI